ncbi:MAG TPA: hypothetical protein VGC97_05455 [Pyrinomonadaceae bacterium]|jgi:hypothetical protein
MYQSFAKLNSLKVLSLLVLLFAAQAALASGGGGTVGPNPLPQTAPAPDVIYRESFGEGPDILRPAGGKGNLKETYTHTPIQGFWIEYPGNKNNAWLAPAEGQTWRFCGASDNPYEMFSPIQMTSGYYLNGCVASEWFDAPTVNPTALTPFTAQGVPYEVSFEGYPAPIEGKYLALGLTNSGTLYSNLATSANVVLVLSPAPPNMYTIHYELRAGGMNGTLLATGDTFFDSWNRMKLRVDPVAKTVGASVNDIELGTFPLNVGAPKYAGFEGVAIGDNFVIRKLQ